MLSRDPRVSGRLGAPLVPVGQFHGKTTDGEARGLFLCRGPVGSVDGLQHQQSEAGSVPSPLPKEVAVVSIDAQYREDDWRFDLLEVVLPRHLTGTRLSSQRRGSSLIDEVALEFPTFEPGEVVQIAPTKSGTAVYSNKY